MIRVLPPQVADAIAAGEVVERPASVVKELVENAIDAGARRIAVEVRGAGRTLIRVVDDGSGIPPGELRLAFQRHATSKVATLEDLAAIETLGFRGEALASVAAVSDLECRSQGARIRLRGGEVREEGAAVAVPGTAVEVRDLFANTPARLKFLKSEATETAACVKTVQAYALLYPEIRFEFTVDGRTVLRSAGDGDARRAAGAVLGAAVADELLEVDGEGVRGLVSQPRLSRRNRDAILLAVNRRPVVSRALGYAVEECYLGTLERGRYPVAVLDVRVPPHDLDVNVHPAKREVRFHAERTVFAAVQRAVRTALTGSRPYRLPPPESGPRWRAPTVHDARPRLPDRPAPPRARGPIPTGCRGPSPRRRRGSCGRSARSWTGTWWPRARRGWCWWTSTPPTSGSCSTASWPGWRTAAWPWPASPCCWPRSWRSPRSRWRRRSTTPTGCGRWASRWRSSVPAPCAWSRLRPRPRRNGCSRRSRSCWRPSRRGRPMGGCGGPRPPSPATPRCASGTGWRRRSNDGCWPSWRRRSSPSPVPTAVPPGWCCRGGT